VVNTHQGMLHTSAHSQNDCQLGATSKVTSGLSSASRKSLFATWTVCRQRIHWCGKDTANDTHFAELTLKQIRFHCRKQHYSVTDGLRYQRTRGLTNTSYHTLYDTVALIPQRQRLHCQSLTAAQVAHSEATVRPTLDSWRIRFSTSQGGTSQGNAVVQDLMHAHRAISVSGQQASSSSRTLAVSCRSLVHI
jgi:hypothetical protein